MFLALRDIRFAKGRFALMLAVVALVTLLLVLLSALTRGLGLQSTSAIDSLPASSVLLAPSGNQTTWQDSVVTQAQVAAADRVAAAQPLGVGHARIVHGDDSSTVAVFGADPTSRVAATLPVAPHGDEVVLARSTADALRVGVGEHVEVNGSRLRVVAVEATRSYSHSPVAWTDLATHHAITHTAPGTATALLLGQDDADRAQQAATAAHLTALGKGASLRALPGYSSEQGSLVMIQGFLYAICGLVTMAFLSVWTIQRTRDLAVVRALGGSRRHVLGDTLGQAALLLTTGTVLGGGVGALAAWGVTTVAPVQVAVTTTLLPAVGVALVGLAGAVLATRRVTTIDPLLALGGN